MSKAKAINGHKRRPRASFANGADSSLIQGGQKDYFRTQPGRPIGYRTEPDASVTPDRVTQSVRMKWNPIRGLTPERLVSYLDQWQLGYFRQAGMMWDMMERRDYQLKIVAPKRKKAVARHGYDVMSVDKLDDSEKKMAEEQVSFLKYFWDHISVTTALEPDEQGGLNLLARQMMDCVGKRYAVHEIVWQPANEGNLSAKFIFCPIWWFEGTRGKLRFLDSEFQVNGRDMEDGEWLVTVGDGIMEACSIVYLFKHLPLKSWLSFLDKFGMPGVHGKTDAQKGSKEWNDFVEAVQDFAEEWAAVTNRSAEISLVEAKSTSGSGSGFDVLVEKMDRALTQLWRGGDLGTTSSQDGTGASLQGDESDILEGDDAVMIEETLSRVSRYALAWKYGPEAPVLAYLKFRQEQDPEAVKFQRDTFSKFAADGTVVDVLANQVDLKKLVQDVGLPVNEEYVDPYLPVSDQSGALITGEVLKDSEGDVIGALPQKQEPTEQDLKGGNREGKPGQILNDDRAGRGQVVGAPSAKLEENSLEEVARAVAADLSHVLERLSAIQQISDPVLMEVKLRKFLADLDQMQADIGHDPETAVAIQKVLASAFVNGASRTGRAATVQNGDVAGHEFHGNQWTEAQAAESGRLRKEADASSHAADQTEFWTPGASDEQKAEAHASAAAKYKAVAEHAKASGDAYAARVVGKRMREKAQYHKDAARYYADLKKKDKGQEQQVGFKPNEKVGLVHLAARPGV